MVEVASVDKGYMNGCANCWEGHSAGHGSVADGEAQLCAPAAVEIEQLSSVVEVSRRCVNSAVGAGVVGTVHVPSDSAVAVPATAQQ